MGTTADFSGEWNSRTLYSAGQVVLYAGIYYSTDGDTIGVVPPNAPWNALSPASGSSFDISGNLHTAVLNGADVAQGSTTDLAGALTVVGQLKQIAANTTGEATLSAQNTFTAAGTGTVIHAPAGVVPIAYSLQVVGTAAAATAWSVVLEVSLDGIVYTTVLTHGSTVPVVDGALIHATGIPGIYFRSRVVSVTLGPATNLVVTVLGKA